ncbi:hypothetical protein [Fusobacterium necrophorum]|uniref:hypothetical protein n=1 Tax=Fusobacterium necrophorum TaxID=859 RepID=UPI00370EF082
MNDINLLELEKRFSNFSNIVKLLTDSKIEHIYQNLPRVISTSEFEKMKELYPFVAGDEKLKCFFNTIKIYCYYKNFSEDELKRIIIAAIVCANGNLDIIYSYLSDLFGFRSLDGFCELITSDKFFHFVQEGINGKKIYLHPTKDFFNNTVHNKRIEKIIASELSLKSKIMNICSYFKDEALKNANILDSRLENDKSVYNKYIDGNGLHSSIHDIGDYIDDIVVYGKPLGYWADHLSELYVMNPVSRTIYMNYLKYNNWVNKLDPQQLECRQIKTIMYLISYILKDHSTPASKRMKKITSVPTGWAVGTEQTSRASFYGNSSIAKATSGYYSFMTGKENPYKNLINNTYHQEIEHQAINLNNEFAMRGLEAIGVSTHLFDGIKILENVKDIITALDEVITVEIGISNFIKSFLSGILNSIANMLDITIAESFKQLFYIKLIPFGEKKVSLADIYNHLEFIKYILKSSKNGEYQNINNLTKEQLLEDMSNAIGIRQDILKEIGYGAYDKELNIKAGVIAFSSHLKKNSHGDIFTIKNDLPFLYILIEFAIQKEAFVYGNQYAKRNMIYGDIHMVNSVLSKLTDTEIYFVTTRYYSNLKELFSKPDNIEHILEINKKIELSKVFFELQNTTMYENYMKENVYLLRDDVDADVNFKAYNFNIIETMLKYMKDVMKENKDSLLKGIEEANNLTDIDDFLMRFLPSLTEFLKTIGYPEFNPDFVVQLISSVQKFIAQDLYAEVILMVRQKIKDMLERVEAETFKKIDESLGDLNASVTMDLNIGGSKFVQTITAIVELVDKYGIQIPDFVLKCFQEGTDYIDNDFTNYEDGLIFQTGTTNSLRDDWTFHEDKLKINKDDKQFMHNNDFTSNKKDYETIIKSEPSVSKKIKRPNETVIHKKPTGNQEILKIIEKDPVSQDEYKIVYNRGDIYTIRKDGTQRILIRKDEPLHKYKKNVKRNNTDDIIERNLSDDQYEKIKDIKNFIDNIAGLEYYGIVKQLKIEREKLEAELSKPRNNKNIIDAIDENIMNLTKKLSDVKTKNILNSVQGFDRPVEILSLKVNKDGGLEHVNDQYKSLNDYFSKKSELIQALDEGLSNPETKDIFLTSYQITELLK